MPNENSSSFSVAIGSFSKRSTRKVMPAPSDPKTPLEAKKGFLFGADPEAFVKDDKGRYVSAEGLIPGTKLDPHPVKFGAVQVDGMAAEFNIDPAPDFKTFDRNINAVVGQLKKMLPKGYSLDFSPSITFDEDVFDATPDHAKELGCMPDIDAWTGGLNPPPSFEENPRLRCAGGHIHIGWGNDLDVSDLQHILNCQDIVKQLDWYLGTWSVTKDSDTVRRKLYGKAGACRYKPYGVEYRVLSNFWVTDKSLRLQVWNRLQMAIGMMSKDSIFERVPNNYNNFVREGINTSIIPSTLMRNFQYPIVTIDPNYAY